MDHPLEILNLDRWDMILGSYFCEHYNVHIDYENKTIKIGETMINALLKDEELQNGDPTQSTNKCILKLRECMNASMQS
jgi:hypothetical protein